MLLEADLSRLILIDYQARLMPAVHDGAAVLQNALRLARAARELGVPVWATEQNPAGLGATDEALRALCDEVVPKMGFSAAPQLLPMLEAVAEPTPRPRGGNARSLPRHLRQPQPAEPARSTWLLAGCEAHVCLLQTALGLLEQDGDVWVVTDACGSRTERNRDAAFDRLAAAGCELVTTEMVLFEWLGSAEHPKFKAVQALIK